MNQENKFLTNILPEFEDDAKNEIQEIWERIPGADFAGSTELISKEETETALQSVLQKTTLLSSVSDKKKNSYPAYTNRYFKFAAAAVLLICALGLGYILTPVAVNVPYGQTRTIHLPDQTTIILNSGSRLSYSRWFNMWSREVNLSGEAYFDVTKSRVPFQVTTSNATITVLGTKFNVRSWPSNLAETMVYLEEGKVSFKSKDKGGKRVILHPGESSRVIKHQKNPTHPVATDQKKALAWKYNGLSFENQSLSTIFAELQRRFDITIRVRPEVIINQNLTIYLSSLKGPEQALRDICQYKGLTYTRKGDIFVVSSDDH